MCYLCPKMYCRNLLLFIFLLIGNEGISANNPTTNKQEVKTNFLMNLVFLFFIIRIICWTFNIEYRQAVDYLGDVGLPCVPLMWILRSSEILKYCKRKFKNKLHQVGPLSLNYLND